MAQILSNLAIGAQIKFGKHQVGSETAQPIIWVVADKNHNGYPANSVTLIAQKIIDLRAYDGAETGAADGNVNYAYSNINQWLNSSASAGNWYTKTHTNDTPPTSDTTASNTAYQSRAGFLYNFTSAERNAMLPTTLVNQVGSNISSKVTSNVFLPSTWEINGAGDISDGSSRFEYFLSHDSESALTTQAFTNTNTANKPNYDGAIHHYFTRSTDASGAKVYTISSSGANSTQTAKSGHVGIRPVINLSATAKISDTTDSSGCYTWIENKPPVITDTNATSLGNKTDDFSITYKITDGDSDSVTVTEYIDEVAIRSYVATLNGTNTFAVEGVTWLKLANGKHTLKIVATDGFTTAQTTHDFTKVANKIVVKRKTAIQSSTRPSKILVHLIKNIPETATWKVEVCNNGFDTSPTWETISNNTITGGIPFEFTNETCTSGKWGVNVRVTVNRNGAQGACYITEIGGNFE